MTRLSIVFSWILALSTLLGCGGGWAMAVPSDVAQVSEELPITGRSSWSGSLVDESFGLGSYRISDVDRKWNSTRSTSFALFGFDESRTRGGYRFSMSASDGKLEADCFTEEREKSKDLGDGGTFSSLVAKLGCACRDAQGEASLVLQASTTSQYEGTLKGADYSYRVSAVTERENGKMSSRDPLGYRVDGEGPIGALGVVKPGRVWINKTLPERARRELACLFAGILIYQPPAER